MSFQDTELSMENILEGALPLIYCMKSKELALRSRVVIQKEESGNNQWPTSISQKVSLILCVMSIISYAGKKEESENSVLIWTLMSSEVLWRLLSCISFSPSIKQR